MDAWGRHIVSQRALGSEAPCNECLLIKYSGTSKSASSINTFGRFGRFLNCLSVIALLSITSRHKDSTHASRLILHRGSVVHRQLRLDEPVVESGRSGTKIEVHNLFGDIPVRSRYMYDRFSSTMEIEKTFELLRGTLTGYLLACSGRIDLSCTLNGTTRRLIHRRLGDSESMSQLAPGMVTSILSQTKPGSAFDSTNWRCASVHTSNYFITAVISIEPAPSPYNQYMTIGNTPLHVRQDHNLFFKIINDRFEASKFGQTSGSISSTAAESIPRKSSHNPIPRRVDRWPMFYIRVHGLAGHEPNYLSQQQSASFSLKDMTTSITQALESLVSHFLIAEGLESTPRRASLQRPDGNRPRNESQQSPHLPLNRTPELGTAKKTSQLSQWHRTKSGRSDPKDIDHGLPFARSACIHYTQAEMHRDVQPLLEEESPDESDIDTPTRGNALVAPDEGDENCQLASADKIPKSGPNKTISWTNPRNERTIHINPRTGSTVANDEEMLQSQNTVATRRCPTRIACLHASEGPNQARLDRNRALNLKPYGGSCPVQRETPITSIPPSEMIAVEDGASADLVQWSNHVTKADLSDAKVLGQVDKKFILIVIKDLIVLIDQHAADERVKLEQLCQDLLIGNPVILTQPLVFEIEEDEAPLFRTWQTYFERWQIIYAVEEDKTNEPEQRMKSERRGLSISVNTLPSLVAERCRAEPPLLIELLRQELWSDRVHRKLATCSRSHLAQSWHAIASSCPEGVLDLLKSRSCRTAIMFNDVLDMQECEELVGRLSKCDLPFQCAHGRPTLTVLTKAGLLDNDLGNGVDGAEVATDSTVGFGAAWGNWSST